MAMPVVLAIQQENGKTDTMTLPVEIWQKGATKTFAYPSVSKIKSIMIDPLHEFPDINPSNNTWTGAALVKPVPAGVSATSVIDKYLSAIGGRDKVAAVKDLTMSSTGNVQGQNFTQTLKIKGPDKYLMQIDLPDMNMQAVRLVVNGDSVTVAQMGQSPAVDEDTKKEIREESLLFPELYFSKEGYKLELISIENINGKDAYHVKATYPTGTVITFFYDVNTGYRLRMEKSGKEGGMTTVDYSDYREVNGIKFPYRINNDQGQVDLDMTVQSIKVNTGLSDDEFRSVAAPAPKK
jgi:outer membrane lipoprotein-sorting protein